MAMINPRLKPSLAYADNDGTILNKPVITASTVSQTTTSSNKVTNTQASNLEHQMNMTNKDLDYAKSELNQAINMLNSFANVGGVALYKGNINAIKTRIDIQTSNVTKYIIPAIKRGVK